MRHLSWDANNLHLNAVPSLLHEMGHIPALVFLSAVSAMCKMSCTKCKNTNDNYYLSESSASHW